MSHQYKVGDRVRYHTNDVGVILAIDDDHAWVKYEHRYRCTVQLTNLTPLPPPEPEPDAIDRAILAFLPNDVFADQRTNLRALVDAILAEARREITAALEPAVVLERTADVHDAMGQPSSANHYREMAAKIRAKQQGEARS